MQRRNDTGNESAGIQFTGCTGIEAMQPQLQQQAQAPAQAAPRRREVVVGGRRVKTIDVHAHCVVPKALELMGQTTSTNQSRGTGISEVGLRRIGEMDAQGIDVEAISINPFWYRAERDLAAEVIKVNNETLTAWCAAHPDRFLGFTSVALQFPDLAVQQLFRKDRTDTDADRKKRQHHRDHLLVGEEHVLRKHRQTRYDDERKKPEPGRGENRQQDLLLLPIHIEELRV